MALLGELQFLRMKGNQTLKPNSTRVCLSAIVDIFICLMSMAETQWEIRTSQPKLTVRSQTVKRPAPTAYNTQMDCHIRFRGIGYYTLGLLFPTQPSAWQDWVWRLSCLVLLAVHFLDKDKVSVLGVKMIHGGGVKVYIFFLHSFNRLELHQNSLYDTDFISIRWNAGMLLWFCKYGALSGG